MASEAAPKSQFDTTPLDSLDTVPLQFREISADDDTYIAFGGAKTVHLETRRWANEGAVIFATRGSDNEQVAIKAFLGAQTRYPELRAGELHRVIAALSEEEQTTLLQDSPEARAAWVDRLADHENIHGHNLNLLTAESFRILASGPAVTVAARKACPDSGVKLVGYGFLSKEGEMTTTLEGSSPKVLSHEEGFPVVVTEYVPGELLYMSESALSIEGTVPIGMADKETYLKYEQEVDGMKRSLRDSGYTDYDVEVMLNPETGTLHLMDLGQIHPNSIESISQVIDAIINIYDLPPVVVRMLANEYWHALRERSEEILSKEDNV